MYKVSLVSEGLIDFIRHFQSKKYSKQSFSIDPSEILGRLHQNALIKMEKSVGRHALIINTAIVSPDTDPPKGTTKPGEYTITAIQKYPNDKEGESGKSLFSNAGDARKALKVYLTNFAGPEVADRLELAALYSSEIQMKDGKHYGYVLPFKIIDSGSTMDFTPPKEAKDIVDHGKPTGNVKASKPKAADKKAEEAPETDTNKNAEKKPEEQQTSDKNNETPAADKKGDKAEEQPASTEKPEEPSAEKPTDTAQPKGDEEKGENPEAPKNEPSENPEKTGKNKSSVSIVDILKKYTTDAKTFSDSINDEKTYSALLSQIGKSIGKKYTKPLNLPDKEKKEPIKVKKGTFSKDGDKKKIRIIKESEESKAELTKLFDKYSKIPYGKLNKTDFYNDIKSVVKYLSDPKKFEKFKLPEIKADTTKAPTAEAPIDPEETEEKAEEEKKEEGKEAIKKAAEKQKIKLNSEIQANKDKEEQLKAKIDPIFKDTKTFVEWAQKNKDKAAEELFKLLVELTANPKGVIKSTNIKIDTVPKPITVKKLAAALETLFLNHDDCNLEPAVKIGMCDIENIKTTKAFVDNLKTWIDTAVEAEPELTADEKTKEDIRLLKQGKFKNSKGIEKTFAEFITANNKVKHKQAILTKLQSLPKVCFRSIPDEVKTMLGITDDFKDQMREILKENLFIDIDSPDNGLPQPGSAAISRDKPLAILWEIDKETGEEVPVFRGRNYDIIADYMKRECDFTKYEYKVEYPTLKSDVEKDKLPKQQKRDVKGASSLPDGTKQLLITIIERKYGVTLDLKRYMKNKELSFIRVQDKHKFNPPVVYTFDDWEAVQDLAYLKDESIETKSEIMPQTLEEALVCNIYSGNKDKAKILFEHLVKNKLQERFIRTIK